MACQHLADRRAHGLEPRGIQRGLTIDRGVAGRQQEVVALARRHLELLGEVEDHVAARLGPSGLHEAEVPGRDLGLKGEGELAQPTPRAPLAQQLADRPVDVRRGRHALLNLSPAYANSVPTGPVRPFATVARTGNGATGLITCQVIDAPAPGGDDGSVEARRWQRWPNSS